MKATLATYKISFENTLIEESNIETRIFTTLVGKEIRFPSFIKVNSILYTGIEEVDFNISDDCYYQVIGALNVLNSEANKYSVAVGKPAGLDFGKKIVSSLLAGTGLFVVSDSIEVEGESYWNYTIVPDSDIRFIVL